MFFIILKLIWNKYTNFRFHSIMEKRRVHILLLCLALLSPATLCAQFYLGGTDRGSLRWRSMDTQHYRIIYPRGRDSLARVYGAELESWRTAVGKSAGYEPCQFQGKRKMPVLLHNEHAVSNGSVVWAPSRMELYTTPDPANPIPMPWETNLAIHEQRHVAQMQTGLTGPLRPLGWFFGQMLNGAACAAYGGQMWMEGDAVIAETALSNSGRGRMASFLDYYMYSFDNGDWRNWYSWSNGSQRYYTPNHYALGYMLLAGLRYNYDDPLISARRFTSFSKNPFRWGYARDIRSLTGKRMDPSFKESANAFYSIWKEEADARAPYIPVDTLLGTPSRHLDYSSLAYSEEGLFAVREGLLHTPELVRIDPQSGKVRKLRDFSYSAGGMKFSGDGSRLVWHEIINDPRWELRSRSVIFSYDIRSGRTRKLSRSGMLFNPGPGPDSSLLVTIRKEDGGSALGLLHEGVREPEKIADAPDGLQIVESCCFEGYIYVSGLSEGGFGIYRLENGKLQCILQPQAATISDFGVEPDGHIHFCSDLNGNEEYYHLDPADSSLHRLTSTRYGGSDWHFSPDGSRLVFCAQDRNGRRVMSCDTDSLFFVPTDFSQRHKWVIADRLSEQERRLGAARDSSVFMAGMPRRYSKFAHALRIHSWAPLYFDYDNIAAMSFDRWYDSAAPGLVVFSQNTLGTLYGSMGYSFHPDPDGGQWRASDPDRLPWRHSGHLKINWAGLYPVFEADLDINDRRAHRDGFIAITTNGKTGSLQTTSDIIDGRPLVDFSLSAYIPWSFSRGGRYCGLVPKLSWNISNDSYDTVPVWMKKTEIVDEEGNSSYTLEYLGKNGANIFAKQSLKASLRFYLMTATASSSVYPRWGIAAECGYYQSIQKGGLNTVSGEHRLLSPHLYAYVYAYMPGFVRQQGLRLSARYGLECDRERIFPSYALNTLPRGLKDNSQAAYMFCGNNLHSLAFSADYAIPVWLSDLHIGGGFAYIKRMVLTPHFDFSLFGNGAFDKSLFSAGLDMEFDFGTLFWLSWPMSAGIRVDYNGGKSFGSLLESGTVKNHWYVGPLFNISF